MARFLIGTVPYVGHVNQASVIARKLIERGHEVWWYTGVAFQPKVESLGAHYAPMKAAPDFSVSGLDTIFPGRKALKGLTKLKYEIKHIFIDAAVGQFQDIQEILNKYPADVLLCERAFLGGLVIHEKGGPLWAQHSISILPFNSQETAPIGLGLMPSATPIGRLRNRVLNWLCAEMLFRDVTIYANQVRASLDLPPLETSYFEAAISPYLYIQGGTEVFEYPRSDLPPQVHFVGPFLPDPPTEFNQPAWWEELETDLPVIHVTQGTVTTNTSDLIGPTLRALADEDVLVIATTGDLPMESVGLKSIPNNARLEPFLPHYCLIPKVDVLISNAGYVAVQIALANGVPIIAAGKTEEKADIANRVAWAGVGINLKTQRPSPNQIRDAVKRILSEPHYKQNAQAIQSNFARHDAATESVVLLERLIRTKSPVLRGEGDE